MAKNANDIDRFLKEIDKLRKKAAGGDAAAPAPPRVKAKPPVVVAKAKPVSKRVSAVPADDVPVVAPARPATPLAVPVAVAVSQAAVVPGANLSAPLIAELGQVATRINRTGAKTPFAKTILAMLTTKQSVPAAFVLKEIFGEPKCRQKP